MKRKLTIEIECGEDHCYDGSEQCKHIACCDSGCGVTRRWVCCLFTDHNGSLCELRDKDGGVNGRLVRCKQCIDAELAAREEGMKCKTSNG